MRGKRAKKYKKLMRQYEVQFGFRHPFQVLLSSDILEDCYKSKIDLKNRLEGVLGGEVKCMVSQCDMRHLYDAKPKNEDLITEAKTYERRRCGHHTLEQPLSSLECLTECVGKNNKHRYVVATQDPKVRAYMRTIPGVPLIYVNKSVMILEPMASATEEVREKAEKAKFKEGLKGRRNPAGNTGEKRKRDDDDESAHPQGNESIAEQSTGDARPQKKKRGPKGPKGPNPLSVRKSKKAEAAQPKSPKPKKSEHPEKPTDAAAEVPETEGGEGAKRKRRRKHKPKGDGGHEGDGEGAGEADGQMDTS